MAMTRREIHPEREQVFLHKGFALMQLKNAVLSLKAVEQVCGKCAARTTVVPALIRDAVVQYGSIFKPSNIGAGQKHRLDSSVVVPDRFRELHDRLITYRDKLFAHVDFDLMDPVKTKNQEGLSWHVDNKGPLDFVERIPEMMALMDHIMQQLGRDVIEEHRELSQEH